MAIVVSGCLACHRIGRVGNGGPGPDLTHVASDLAPAALRQSLIDPPAPMPSFRHAGKARLDALGAYLKTLR